MATSPIGPNEVVINDSNFRHFLEGGKDSHGRKTGKRPRDYTKHPHLGCAFAPPFSVPLITDPKEQQARLDEQIAKKAQTSNVRNVMGPGGKPVPSRDQNGKGYCWAHSSVSAMLMVRALMGEPYIDLSAFAIACIIKGYQDEGGWGSESMEWIAANGVPTSKTWPQQSMSRSNDNPQMRAEAAKQKYTRWEEIPHASMRDAVITCALLNIPLTTDFNWWGHSVSTIDLVSLNPFRTRIWNSWGDSWSENGTGILEGSKALPDDAWAALVATPSLP